VRIARALLEIFCLFAALFFIQPYIPSHEGFVHTFNHMHWIAIALFGASRALRWSERWWIAVLEAAAFGIFVLAMVLSYNML
jgi:VIT1/CCC1 family predicted Fe2+/Mn2+ transporter